MNKEQWLQGLRDAFSGTMKRWPVGHLQDSLAVSLGSTLRLNQGCNNYQPILSEGRSSQTEEMVVGNPPWQDPPAYADLILSQSQFQCLQLLQATVHPKADRCGFSSGFLGTLLPTSTTVRGTLLSPQLCAV